MSIFNSPKSIFYRGQRVRVEGWSGEYEVLYPFLGQVSLRVTEDGGIPEEWRQRVNWVMDAVGVVDVPEGMVSAVDGTVLQVKFPDGNPDYAHDYPTKLGVIKRYRAAGCNPLPILLDGTKFPPCKWGVLQQRPISESEITSYWCRPVPYGIGVACGPISGNLEVVDVDDHTLYIPWRDVVEAECPGLLDRLVISQTGSGAYQVWYRCSAVERSDKLARDLPILKDDGTIKEIPTLIETRGTGGLVVAPGSPLEVHNDRNPYRFLQGGADTIPVITPEERAVLLRAARSFNRYTPHAKPRKERAGGEEFEEDPDAPWTDFNRRASWQSILEPAGWTLSRGDWERGLLTRPGKDPRHGGSATVGECGDLLYVFTTSSRFEGNAAYSKSAAWAVLNHDGDFEASARDLIERGYGRTAREQAVRERVEEAIEAVFAGRKRPEPAPRAVAVFNPAEPTMPDGEGSRIALGRPLDVAKDAVARNWLVGDVPILRQRDRSWWLWTGRRYAQKDDADIRRDLTDWLARCVQRIKDGDEFKEVAYDPRIKHVNEVFSFLQGLVLADDLSMPTYIGDSPPEPGRVIGMDNGLFLVDRFLAGEQPMVEHTPRWFSANCLPFAYDPGAACPTWDRFIREVMSGDPECIRYLQKWVGYNLIQDGGHHVVTFLVGSGANGKSTFLGILMALLGEGNYCTPTFSDISERFGRYQFLGKLAAIFPDAHLGRDSDSSRCLEFVKNVSGGDPVNLEEKGKPMLKGVKLHTRVTLAVNEMPRLPDASRALSRRVRVIPFHQSFEGREDRDLPRRLLSEIPGIFNWAVDGLRLLAEDGDFRQPAAGEGIRADFLADSSPIGEFVETYCDIGDPDGEIDKKTFRHLFSDWCVDGGYQTMTDMTITKKLRAISSKIGTGKARRDGQFTPVFRHLKWNPDGFRLLATSKLRSGV